MSKGKKDVGVVALDDPQKDNKYKVIYHFNNSEKINLNKILKKSFLLSLDAERK